VAGGLLKDISNRDFDPHVADEIAFGSIENPWPIMAEHRRKSPITPGEYRTFFGADPDPTLTHMKHYTAWRYEEVDAILSDPVLFSSAIAHKLNAEKAFGRILVCMDPPEHGRYRRYLQNLFSPKAVKLWTERFIRPVINELIDGFAGTGSAELVKQFTYRYPFEAVYRLLDLPPDDVELFHKLAVVQTFAIGGFIDEGEEAGRNLEEYFRGLVAERRKSPGDDMISRLARIEVDGQPLDEPVLLAFLRHILNASGDTSYRVTGCLLVGLLSDPALLAPLRADRELIPLAVEEALRWEGPVVTNFRTLTRNIEMVGVKMDAGSVIHAVQSSANRDETRFDDPDRFDIHRSRKHRHFGFGGGPHVCVGMHLARLQIKEAIGALLERLPNLRLDPAAPPPKIRGFHFRAPDQIKVKFG
jgi:cytochrome P450